MAREDLYSALAEALSQPSKAYRTFQEGVGAVDNIGRGYHRGLDIQERLRKRKLQQSSLRDVLGGQVIPGVPEQLSDLPIETLSEIAPIARFRNDTESADDSELKRELMQARIEALRRPPQPKPVNPLDEELKREKLNQMKKGRNSEKSVQDAYQLYEEAKKGLLSGLGGSATGPFVGRIPAVTAKQQIARGSVAAMAPVLKQLFRVAGEGVFTDRDQQLLLDMIPTRSEQPEARAAMIQNIDNIVKAKLGISGESSLKVKVSNGQETREIDPSDIQDAINDGYKPVQ